MPSESYYRKQADICARLAGTAANGEIATRFKVLALELLLKAATAPKHLKGPDTLPRQAINPASAQNKASSGTRSSGLRTRFAPKRSAS
jgi:hypothetical protein